ncbi:MULTISPECIES: helix-turn-helix transcriptional regulator [unclassified Pseudofrankia]|uniref:helix-turn-helix domain-containing protein n=1 Tax=unclassified Pseudofrankia TaxID=2994372 RepID=UPI0008D8EFA8|nr:MULTISPECIES: helix-turn-helix transcriptional regulator [unclassified Pseudofrankia]MDT3441802.1 helix-turn-helix transcriptional regulator [Pseudofrankia sp. BMG5.37]OHV47090.1 transcriptional regulator [Pseudofrankia sp. BMG5.36]
MTEDVRFRPDALDLSQPSGDVGAALATLRHQKGITGEALGLLVGFSQAKISKIERGALRASPKDAEKIAAALDASADLVAKLVEWAEQAYGDGANRRAPTRRGTASQQEVFAEEGTAAHVREFQPIAVPGLLQISEYARRVINGYHAIMTTDPSALWAETATMVSLRIQRQERLYDPSKTFEFLLMEAVLANRFASPGSMLAQVDRIEQVSRLPNVTIRIVPQTAELGLPPLHGFQLFDDDMVITEAVDSTIFRDRRSVEFYTHFYNAYVERTVTDLTPILEHYKALYASLALPKDD